MIKLYHGPRTRSVRIYWLLEELGLPYELVTVPFVAPLPPAKPFSQATPAGKFPTLEDGEVTMFESGAILEYVIERYGQGRLAPAPGTPQRAAFLQWVHFSEATAFPPLGNIAWHMFRQDADSIPAAMADYRTWAVAALDVLEKALAGRQYLLGPDFSAADIMVGYTVQCAKWFGLLSDDYRNLTAYLARLTARPAFQKALS
ncbi:MAG: glutathione S-transferase family protein [Deltaproteobacteria bacterium]|nr:glutathione S-transferase family protein [Deltaproteobacteria bacterium]